MYQFSQLAAQRGAVDNSSAIRTVNLLGVKISPTTLSVALALMEEARASGRKEYVCCLCVNSLVEARRNPAVLLSLNRAWFNTQDGAPLAWWCRLKGFLGTERVCGRDLLESVCAVGLTRGYRHFFYGGAPEVTAKLVRNLRLRFPGLQIVGRHSPPFRELTPEEDAVNIAMINDARPDFVWVGLGTPKQDRWMAEHVGKIDAAVLVGVGAAFDYLGDNLRPAPNWMQRAGLEWLFRLLSEPRRLAHRYLVGNCIFLVCIAVQLLGWKFNTAE